MRRAGAPGIDTLGPRLLRLAARVVAERQDYDLASIAALRIERLGEACKISALDGDCPIVLTGTQATRQFALTVAPGQLLPLHTSAASKVLLAGRSQDELDRFLLKPLVAYKPRTLTEPRRLRAELARQGYAPDKGEYAPSVHAFAAPIPDRNGRVVAALSVPYIAGAEAECLETIRAAVVDVAGVIAADLPPAKVSPSTGL